MCLFIPTSKIWSKSSHQKPKPEAYAKDQNHPTTNALHPQPRPARPYRHGPTTSQVPKDIDYHHPDTQHLPHTRAPVKEIPRRPSRDRTPKPATVSAQIPSKPKARKTSTNEKHHANHQNQNQEHKPKNEACAPQQPHPKAPSHQKPHTKAKAEQQTELNPQQSLLNNQGIPFRSIQAATKERLLSQGRDAETDPGKPRKGKDKEDNCTPIPHAPTPAESTEGNLAPIKERPEPKDLPSPPQPRRPKQPTLRPSPERKPKIVLPTHNPMDLKNDHNNNKPTDRPHSIQHKLPKPHRIPEHQYRCAICKITVSRDTVLAFKGSCPACLNFACLHPASDSRSRRVREEGRECRGEGGGIGRKGRDGRERKVVGEEGRKERREKREKW